MKPDLVKELRDLAFAVNRTESEFATSNARGYWDQSVELLAAAGEALQKRDSDRAHAILCQAWASLGLASNAKEKQRHERIQHTN